MSRLRRSVGLTANRTTAVVVIEKGEETLEERNESERPSRIGSNVC